VVAHPAHTIGVVRYPGAQAAAIHGLIDLFETANRLRDAPEAELPRARVRGARAKPVPVRLAIELIAAERAPAAPATPLTALILPPSIGDASHADRGRSLAGWIRERHREGTLVCSVCAGGFLLAETGLLDARPATTHWALRESFAARFPAVALDVDRLIIDDGDVITAGGVMAWVDLGLRLIERFLGPAIMLRTARYFLVDPGGREQRFYRSFAPPLLHGDAAILKAQHWLHAHCREPVTQPMMARRAGLGTRTFLRRFVKATALAPIAYLQQLRVSQARELLELTTLSISEVAWRVGYADPSAFRKRFTRVIGLTPGAYRQRFAASR
jgi:transcriptional regulator GlxA family with amidase domain